MEERSRSSNRAEPRPPAWPEPKSSSWPPETALGMLSESARDGLISLGTLREYRAGSLLFMEGDTTKHVLVLQAGWVKVVADIEQGGQALLALRSRGDLVGEQEALDNEPRSASVISASPVMAYAIQQRAFLQYLADHPDVHLAVTRALSAKLRSATRRRVDIDFGGLPSDVRLALVLSELAGMNSRPTSAGTELGYALSQPELAAMVGISEPAVQRALRKLRDSDVLETGYRRIIIRDMAALTRVAGPGRNSGQESVAAPVIHGDVTLKPPGNRLDEESRAPGAPVSRTAIEVPISVYLAGGREHSQVESALHNLLSAFDIEVAEEQDPEISSWYRRILGRAKETSPSLEEVVEKAVRAIEMNTLLLPQAGVDAAQGDALAKLITALGHEDNAVIQIGSMLLVKTGGVLAARNLTQMELAYLEKNPILIKDPHKVMQQLQDICGPLHPDSGLSPPCAL